MLLSAVAGVFVTVAMTVAAFATETRTGVCVFLWHACLVQTVIHTPGDFEATPIDLFAFLFGALLGMPIYAALAYLLMKKFGAKENNDEGDVEGRGAGGE